MKYNEAFLQNYLEKQIDKTKDNLNFKKEYFKSIPKKLYRFRQCEHQEFEALEEGYIWLSKASEFNDVKDSTVGFYFNRQNKKIKQKLMELILEGMTAEINKAFKGRNIKLDNELMNLELVNEYFSTPLATSDKANKTKLRQFLIKKGLKQNDIRFIEGKVKKAFDEEEIKKEATKIQVEFQSKLKELRDSRKVCCFTSTYKNDNLWETYTKNYTGFCIEYDLSYGDSNNKEDDGIKFSPLLYRKKKPADFFDIFSLAVDKMRGKTVNQEVLNDYDILFNKHIRTKSKTYAHEKEWRFFQDKKKYSKREYRFPYAEAIYLGFKINDSSKIRLIEIAKNNSLCIYEQRYCELRSEFQYKKIEF